MKKKEKFTHGGARPGAGNPGKKLLPIDDPTDYEKVAQVLAAQSRLESPAATESAVIVVVSCRRALFRLQVREQQGVITSEETGKIPMLAGKVLKALEFMGLSSLHVEELDDV